MTPADMVKLGFDPPQKMTACPAVMALHCCFLFLLFASSEPDEASGLTALPVLSETPHSLSSSCPPPARLGSISAPVETAAPVRMSLVFAVHPVPTPGRSP